MASWARQDLIAKLKNALIKRDNLKEACKEARAKQQLHAAAAAASVPLLDTRAGEYDRRKSVLSHSRQTSVPFAEQIDAPPTFRPPGILINVSTQLLHLTRIRQEECSFSRVRSQSFADYCRTSHIYAARN
jgi:hypothetical protein